MKFKLLLLLSCVSASVCAMEMPPAPRGFGQLQAITTHKRNHGEEETLFDEETHIEHNTSSAIATTAKKAKLDFACRYSGCGRLFAMKAGLVRHMNHCKLRAPDQDPFDFPCSNSGCKYACDDYGTFKLHELSCKYKTVKKDIPFNCPKCKDFTTTNFFASIKHKKVCGIEEQTAELVTPLTPPSTVRADELSEEILPIVTRRSQKVIDDLEYAAQEDEDSLSLYVATKESGALFAQYLGKLLDDKKRAASNDKSEIEFVCDYCYKKCKNSQSLDRHKKTHAASYPCATPGCNHKAPFKSWLEIHNLKCKPKNQE